MCSVPMVQESICTWRLQTIQKLKELDTEIPVNEMKIKGEVEELKEKLQSARDNNSKNGGREGSATAGVPSKNMQKKIRKLDPRCTGRLARVAAKILMQVLYAARYARCDVIRCINMMACYTTKWTATQDQELDDLMGYAMETVTWTHGLDMRFN